MQLKRKENETNYQHHKRLVEGKLVDKTLANMSYEDLAPYVYGKEYSEDVARRMMYGSRDTIQLFEQDIESNILEDDTIELLEKKKFELDVARKKIQRINHEYHRNARKMADVSLTKEQILESISNLEPIKIKETVYREVVGDEVTGVLACADVHYGDEFVLKNAFGEIINEYSPEIFKTRMWKLLSDLENESFDMKIDKLEVLGLGDSLSGVLRATSSLQQLKVGVVDGAMEYAEFMAIWLNELQNRLNIPIIYSATGGNHTALRLLSSKNNFPNEQMEKVIHQFIELRLRDNKNITITPYNDIIIRNVYGLNILVYHGEDRNLQEALNFFENYNNISLDFVITGHLHSKSTTTSGIGLLGDRELLRVNSLMGCNEYSTHIRRSSRAGAELLTFNKDGQQWRKTFYLN